MRICSLGAVGIWKSIIIICYSVTRHALQFIKELCVHATITEHHRVTLRSVDLHYQNNQTKPEHWLCSVDSTSHLCYEMIYTGLNIRLEWTLSYALYCVKSRTRNHSSEPIWVVQYWQQMWTTYVYQTSYETVYWHICLM